MNRNQRIQRYTPLVERVARQMLVRLPPSVTWEELVSAGYVGLIEAVDRFDPERNVDFSAFARTRIRGAMLDSLRELDLLPRSVREQLNAVQRARKKLEQQLDRPPELHEIAQEAQLTPERIHELFRYQLQTNFVSFDEPVPEEEADRAPIHERLVDEEALTADDILELGEANDILRDAFDNLPERLRLLIVLYYVEELTMQEIAVMMSVSIGRISQLHTQAIQKLRKTIGDGVHVDRRRLSLLFRTTSHTDS